VNKFLHTPLTEEDIRALHVGDTVHISGRMFTARDEAHRLMLERRENDEEIPFDPSKMALFHCGPVVKKEDAGWRVLSAGPTTSIRMELFEDRFLTAFGTKMVIGKGGMGDKTLAALRKAGAVYAHYPGGVGALAAQAITRVADVYWLDEKQCGSSISSSSGHSRSPWTAMGRACIAIWRSRSRKTWNESTSRSLRGHDDDR